jgi:RNA polymerase sigma factor (sigma-70 family)
MRQYVNSALEELARELAAGLARLKRGYVDAAEALVQIIDPRKEYPYEFVVYRLTGYRRRGKQAGAPMSGESVIADLLRLMLDVCDSAAIRCEDYAEAVCDTPRLATRFGVSEKTVQRWRKRGLAARRLIFPDGRRRIAFLESSVAWFVRHRQTQVLRSVKFTQMTAEERGEVIRRAMRMTRFTPCTLSDVARRIASRTGRAVETVRYTIRKHDAEHPRQAVFPKAGAPLGERERTAIYRSFLRGAPVPVLAERHRRTRSSIYRIVNEMRARQIVERDISYVYNPQFDLPNADELILGAGDDGSAARAAARAPADLPPYLRALYDVPLLTPQRERELFRRYNYLKFKADRLRKQIDLRRISAATLRRVETYLLQANVVKNRIIRANLRLVVSIAKKHMGGPQTLFELVSDGNVSLMRAVEKFDYARGNRFSTYASWAIMRNFARSVPRERYQLDRFSTGHDEILDIAAGLRSYDPTEVNIAELRESIDVVLTHLSPTERRIVIDHYGLDESRPQRTFEQLGRHLGMSKERVRQIEARALKKLRKILHPQQADLLA